MSKAPNKRSLILPFVIGIILGITAKLVDMPAILVYFSIFDDIMGRFGIWVWTSALIAILSKITNDFVGWYRYGYSVLWFSNMAYT